MIKSKVGKVHEVTVDDIVFFQGDLKELSEENYEKLKDSITEHGIISPGYAWKNGGKWHALDCHQRLKVLKQMKLDGFDVPEKFPIVEIFAKSKREAKLYLLQYISQHGTVTEDGLYEYLHESELLDDLDTLDSLNIDGIDLDQFKEGYFNDDNGGENEDEPGKTVEEEGGNAEKFTFIVRKSACDIVHSALKKAEKGADSDDGAEQLIEICRKYLKGRA